MIFYFILPPGKRPSTHRIGGWLGRSGRVRKISPPPGFDPQAVQPVASRYTDSYPGPLYSNYDDDDDNDINNENAVDPAYYQC
jgi:hypothetical protein